MIDVKYQIVLSKALGEQDIAQLNTLYRALMDKDAEIGRLRATLTKAYQFISPLSDPMPITNREMAAEIMRALEQKADGK